MAEGYECGVTLEHFNDVKEGDVFESYIMEEYRGLSLIIKWRAPGSLPFVLTVILFYVLL